MAEHEFLSFVEKCPLNGCDYVGSNFKKHCWEDHDDMFYPVNVEKRICLYEAYKANCFMNFENQLFSIDFAFNEEEIYLNCRIRHHVYDNNFDGTSFQGVVEMLLYGRNQMIAFPFHGDVLTQLKLHLPKHDRYHRLYRSAHVGLTVKFYKKSIILCRFSDFGCQHSAPRSQELTEHEKYCTFQVLLCQALVTNKTRKCREFFNLPDYAQHLLEDHVTELLINGSTVTVKKLTREFNEKELFIKDDFLIFRCFLKMYGDEDEDEWNNICFTVQSVTYIVNPRDYSYELEIEDKNNVGRPRKFNRDCSRYQEFDARDHDVPQEESYVYLTESQMESYYFKADSVHNFSISIKVSKKKVQKPRD